LLGQHLPRLAEGGAWRSPFERHLGRRVLVLDGAMGTALLAAGMAPEALDRAAITQPTAVLAVHRAMRAAGAEALTAHTFRCNRFALGSVAAAVETAAAGVRLARQAAGGQAFVLGSIGPLGPVVGADLDAQTAADAAGEVAIAMADAGADAIVLETLPSTREANALLRGVRAACDLPVIVCRSFTRDDAAEITAFAVAMEAGGAAAIGANCGNGPAGLHAVLRRLLAATRLPVLARPHAGFPELTDSSARYRLEPAWFARQAEQYCLAGAAAVGGCCGVSHEHIAALAGLAGRPVLRQEGLPLLLTPAPAAVPMPVLPAPFNALGRDFATVALLGGPGGTPSPAAAQALAAAGVHAVGHLAGTASDVPARLPARLRALADACGRPAVLDLPAQAIDREQAQNALLTAHLLGLRLVLIDGGIFSGLGGRSPRPAGVEGLLRLITDLNAGVDRAGVRLEQPTAFGVGVRLRAEDLADTARYAALGARFVAVAPVYEPERWRSALAAADNALPILAEVLVLPDAATAEALANEMPGIEVPPHVRQRLVEEPDQDLRGVLAFLHHWRHRLAGVVLLVPNDETRPAVAVLAGIRSH
jgi:homocysteine S-methyltransferase